MSMQRAFGVGCFVLKASQALALVFLLTVAMLGTVRADAEPAESADAAMAEEQPVESGVDAETAKLLQEMALSPQQKQLQAELDNIDWKVGPTTVDVGTNATLEIPAGVRYTGIEGAKTLMKLNHNPWDPATVGVLLPVEDSEDAWMMIFDYEETGYIKDSEKDSLDADALLESYRAGTEASNAQRVAMGGSPMTIVGWQYPPKYDETSKNLTWAILAQSSGEEVVNYMARVLGRRGVVATTLIESPENLAASVAKTNEIMTKFKYKPGETYAEWTAGDKVAEIGLAGLILGAGATVAAKAGLFAKLGILLAKGWKLILIVVVGIGAGIAKLFGRRSET